MDTFGHREDVDERGDDSGVPSLYKLSALAISRNLWLYRDFSTMPPPAARIILDKARDLGQLSLVNLLKFAHVPISELDLSSGGVDDEWGNLLSSLPLRSLNLSNNPAVRKTHPRRLHLAHF